MRWTTVCILFLLSAVNLRAQQQGQEHCPPNGQSKTGGNPTVSWTSYMVKTDGGICVERSVHTQGQIYINWPAADMNGLWVTKEWSIERCCFSDTTVKNGDLEYGIAGSKLKTTVYLGFPDEIAATGGSKTWLTGELLSGDKVVYFDLEVKTTSSPTPNCTAPEQQCRSYRYEITNSKLPLDVKWDRGLVPEFTYAPKEPNEGYVLDFGKTAGFVSRNKGFAGPGVPATGAIWFSSPEDELVPHTGKSTRDVLRFSLPDGKITQKYRMPDDFAPAK
jgi:hypothetical protein